jgi:hypothetical protein
MRADLYRDAHVGIRARLADLDRRIRERETELTDAFWTSLEPYLRERLAELRAALELIGTESFEMLAQAEARLSAYIDELEAWIARAPSLEEEWLAVPAEVDDPPLTTAPHPRPLSIDTRAFLRTFDETVRETVSEVEIVHDNECSCLARFRHRDAPFALRASVLPSEKSRGGEVSMQLVTSVARATPRLVVKHEALFAAVSKAMGWRCAVEIGDASFDGLFLIQGAKRDAMHFLGPRVRTFLLMLARFDVPTLEIDPSRRVASLSWCFEPAVPAIDAAIRTLTLIRETPSTIVFRR